MGPLNSSAFKSARLFCDCFVYRQNRPTCVDSSDMDKTASTNYKVLPTTVIYTIFSRF